MSFDPFGVTPQPLPPDRSTDTPGENTGSDPRSAARSQVQIPGSFLIAIGVLNLLGSLFPGSTFIIMAVQPAENVRQMLRQSQENTSKMLPNQDQALKQIDDMKPEDLKRLVLITYGITTGVILLAALIVILAGVRMIQLRAYGLCVLGSLTAAVPCISPSCCAVIGLVIGVWALVVLLSAEVRAAFH
jgi:hypothetical protein